MYIDNFLYKVYHTVYMYIYIYIYIFIWFYCRYDARLLGPVDIDNSCGFRFRF